MLTFEVELELQGNTHYQNTSTMGKQVPHSTTKENDADSCENKSLSQQAIYFKK